MDKRCLESLQVAGKSFHRHDHGQRRVLEVASERWRKLSPEEKSVTPRYHKANVHFCQCKGYEKGMELRAEPFPCWHRQAANIVEEYVNVLRRAYGEQTVGIPSLAAQENPQATPHATTSTTSHTPHATSFTTIATRPVDSAVPDYMADLYPD